MGLVNCGRAKATKRVCHVVERARYCCWRRRHTGDGGREGRAGGCEGGGVRCRAAARWRGRRAGCGRRGTFCENADWDEVRGDGKLPHPTFFRCGRAHATLAAIATLATLAAIATLATLAAIATLATLAAIATLAPAPSYQQYGW